VIEETRFRSIADVCSLGTNIREFLRSGADRGTGRAAASRDESKDWRAAFFAAHVVVGTEAGLLHIVDSVDTTALDRNPRRVSSVQWPIRLNALRRGEEEILITPLNGAYIAIMMTMAPETASAQATSVTNIVLVRGAKRPKLVKMKVSHKTTTTSKGNERELCSVPRNINQ
jgi:hypothetical protein